MNERRIERGDTVIVAFNTGQCMLSFDATVESVPCQTGEPWIFVDNQTGDVHYVTEGCTVSKKAKRV
jgi:uncharacterized Fe-S cluster protein YjdI